ncbi:hypothetical protein KKF84_03580 [Myxococcota bacterium]|nr:hypothetical protein [Myxococcota bacterium]
MFLYWKLKELEEQHFSGALHFSEGTKVTGRVFINNGFISWAQASGQNNTLFTAMQSFAQINGDDIRFADSMYQEQKERKNFVSVLQSSGIIGFYALRECMRAHLYEAVAKINENPSVSIHEDPETIAEASQHVFTVDELEYGEEYFSAPLPHLQEVAGVTQIEVRMLNYGLVLKWPEEAEEDKVARELAIVHAENMAKFEDLKPNAVTYHYPHGSYTAVQLKDFFNTSLIVAGVPGCDLGAVARAVGNMPAAVIMHVADSTIPLVDLLEIM